MNDSLLATPLAAPRTFGSTRVVVLALAAIGALLVRPAIADNPEVGRNTDWPGGWAAVAICTALVSVAHATFCARAKSTTGVVVRSLGVGLMLGVVNAGLSLAASLALSPNASAEAVFGGFFLGCLFGSFLGGAWGTAFGLAYAPLLSLLSAQRRTPSVEDGEVALVASGGALMLAAVLREAVLRDVVLHDVVLHEGALSAAALSAWPQALAALVGLVAITRGAVGLLRRRSFVARVRAGTEPGWSVMDPAAAPWGTGLPRLVRSDAPAAVLCRIQPIGSGAYRAGEGWTAIALVPAAAEDAGRVSSVA